MRPTTVFLSLSLLLASCGFGLHSEIERRDSSGQDRPMISARKCLETQQMECMLTNPCDSQRCAYISHRDLERQLKANASFLRVLFEGADVHALRFSRCEVKARTVNGSLWSLTGVISKDTPFAVIYDLASTKLEVGIRCYFNKAIKGKAENGSVLYRGLSIQRYLVLIPQDMDKPLPIKFQFQDVRPFISRDNNLSFG